MLPQIKHIVVLMMENHSFDNYLGTLGRGEGFRIGDDGTPDAENPDSAGTMIRAHHAPSTVQQHGVPCQSWSASHTQWAGGKMNGFVTSTEQAAPEGDKTAAMAYWTDQDLPFYHGLARTFPLADRWFSSCLGPTFPNRRFLLAGTANGLMDDLPFNLLDRPQAGTIMDMLTRHEISWVNYRPAGSDQSEFRRYVQYRRRRTRHHLASLGRPLRKTSDVFKRDLQFTSAIYPLGMASYMAHVRSIERFFADADSGNLPSFCIVDPDFGSFSEENPQDIRKGESFAAEVISRVMHGPGWADTLLIWTYDEHGGYYDHVAPPAAVPPDDRPRPQPGRAPVPAAQRAEGAVPRLCAACRAARRGPGCLRHLRVPGARRDRVTLCAAGLRPVGRLRPHLGAEAHRGEVESARADPAGRGGDLAARRAGPDGSAGVPDAAAAARAGAGVGHVVGRRIASGRIRR